MAKGREHKIVRALETTHPMVVRWKIEIGFSVVIFLQVWYKDTTSLSLFNADLLRM